MAGVEEGRVELGRRGDAVSVAEVRVTLRAGIDAGSWRQKATRSSPLWPRAIGRAGIPDRSGTSGAG